jgi:hypothetical protein
MTGSDSPLSQMVRQLRSLVKRTHRKYVPVCGCASKQNVHFQGSGLPRTFVFVKGVENSMFWSHLLAFGVDSRTDR